MDIDGWRKKIDELDLQIVKLISARAQAAQEIGRLKRATSLPVYEPNRERVIFDNVRSHNPGPLPDAELVHIYERMIEIGFNVHRTTGAVQTILAGVGTPGVFDHKEFEVFAGVAEVIRISSPYKLAGRSFRPEGTVVHFPNGVNIGGDEVVVMAGPCSVESREQILACAYLVQSAGAKFLRGGAFKPR